jgi:ankyrin repeat protein
MIFMLAEMGVEVNMPDSKGNTPLLVAVQNQKETSVKFLISLGANVNTANDHGHTPLHVAV